MREICKKLFFIYFLTLLFLFIETNRAVADSIYNYDINGNLKEATTSLGTINYTYDANGNLIRSNSSDNLLANGTYEMYQGSNGVSKNWDEFKVRSSGSYEVSQISANEYAQRITGTGIEAGGAIGVSQAVKVEAGKAFHVSGSFNIAQLTDAKIQLYVDFYNATRFIGASVTESSEITQEGT